jgi:hypothetical protein
MAVIPSGSEEMAVRWDVESRIPVARFGNSIKKFFAAFSKARLYFFAV